MKAKTRNIRKDAKGAKFGDWVKSFMSFCLYPTKVSDIKLLNFVTFVPSW